MNGRWDGSCDFQPRCRKGGKGQRSLNKSDSALNEIMRKQLDPEVVQVLDSDHERIFRYKLGYWYRFLKMLHRTKLEETTRHS